MTWWHNFRLPGTAIDRASIKFPFELELLPGVLRSRITLNSFSLAGEELHCWTYASDGLKNAGQKELLISIRKMPGESVTDFSQAPLKFFKTVWQHALKGEFIDIGSISDFGESGFLRPAFCGAAYVAGQSTGDWFAPEDTLATILLTQEEIAASQVAGLTRVLALLGRSCLHFPCPVWNDLSRTTVVSAEMLALMSESFIAQMPRILVRSSGVSAEGSVIDLQLPLSARHYFKQLSELDKDSPLLLLVDFDRRADAMLVFQEDNKTTPLAVSAPGTVASRVAGSFICFVPAQNTDRGMIIEDGFALSLRGQTWDELRLSLVNGSPFYLARHDDGYDFCLSFHQDETSACGPDTIQISGSNFTCHSTVSKVDGSRSAAVPAYATDVDMLCDENEIGRLAPDVLRRYIMHIEDIVRDHFMCMGETDGFLLTLQCTIFPEGKVVFESLSNPVMEAEDEKDLLDRLSLAFAPHINDGTIAFKIEFAVWGGISKGDC